MKGGVLAAAVLLLCGLVRSVGAQEPLVVDLSEKIVAITTGFVGSSLLLFGATEGEGDVTVVVRGPLGEQVVRRKELFAGVWMNREQMIFERVPSFYAVASNRFIDDFLAEDTRRQYQLGLRFLDFTAKAGQANGQQYDEFRAALIRNKQRQGLYRSASADVVFVGERLFRSRIHFPANVPVGTYGVDVYLFRDGALASLKTTLVNVRKFGAEASVFDFAHRYALAYGLLAVLVAGVAGWLASVVFRKS